jgi:hypothetical protein
LKESRFLRRIKAQSFRGSTRNEDRTPKKSKIRIGTLHAP